MRKLLPFFTCALLLLAACDPKFNWREVHGKDAPFTVLLPAKPATLTRPIRLGEQEVNMSMTGAEVGHVSFAVGSVEMPDPARAQAAVNLMQAALVNNINGKSKTLPAAGSSGDSVDIEAVGTSPDGQAMLLIAHFAVVGKRGYQVIVLGPQKEVVREEAATFISSFKPN
ncbi:MAG: hypothetical protein JO002_15185 [Burkholderiaceae bacterium]|nr:hypothetical protein [Burkholderiaceae bacterium]